MTDATQERFSLQPFADQLHELRSLILFKNATTTMTKKTTAINQSSSPPSRVSPFNRSLSSPPPPSKTSLQKLGPLPRVGTNPSKVHCMISDELNDGTCDDDTCTRTEKKTSTSIQPWFAKLSPKKSQDPLLTCNTRRPIPSLRRALSHRSISSSSYCTAQQRRDSLDLVYKQSEKGIKYRPAVPHPLMEMAGEFDKGILDADEGNSFKMPSSLADERSRRGAQA